MGKKKLVQLGYGMQGKACLSDLLRTAANVEELVVADSTPGLEEELRALGDPRLRPVRLDASKREELAAVMAGADVVIELLPGTFAIGVAKLAAELGVHLVSTMYLLNPGERDESAREAARKELAALDTLMKAKDRTILQEFGMDPGIDLAVGRHCLNCLDEVRAFHSYGAGFPERAAANNPLRYKFTWSLIGVMRSYLRPAVVIRNGRAVWIPADAMFSAENTHRIDIPEMGGPLECFPNGDSSHFARAFGLEETVEAMGRYICRWPGHGAFWETMATCGFLSETPLYVNGCDVIPAAFCAALLGSQEQFFYGKQERDVALIRTDARGMKDGKPWRVICQIVDRRNLETGFTAMQRTVGFPASIGAQMILDGRIAQRGVVGPEEIPFDAFRNELARRGIVMTQEEGSWDGKLEP
ncbi:saccharopine dehydrogenase C-terminal domain-containing protein [Aminiphilus sp.]|jgi:saccharopine dehydrogenase-like NADP-dependent oxidoreductase|uniref:saccharopine dehydrogenase family protein n=1 Tax=Aminiphilus sp. TaxID=1872488 RepID=UPI00261FD3AF|nr:saccharopine dehydrogenase C-terminal domain-containing protein [Aminiphilus sp.]